MSGFSMGCTREFTEEAGGVADYVVCLANGNCLHRFDDATGIAVWGSSDKAVKYGLAMAEATVQHIGDTFGERPQIREWSEYEERYPAE